MTDIVADTKRMSERLATTTGLRLAFIAVAAGAASAFAFAPIHAMPILLVTFPILFWLALPGERTNPSCEPGAAEAERHPAPSIWARIRRAAGVGWLFGFGFHLAGLYWIGSAFLVEADRFAWLMPFAVVLMPAGLAVFHAFALAMASCVSGTPILRAIAMALALAATEWLRGTILTGFPWNTLGYALTQPLVLMQSAGVFGIYGLSLLTALLATLPAVALTTWRQHGTRQRDASLILTLCLLPLGGSIAYGIIALSGPAPPDIPEVRVRLVQPNIPQRDKFLNDRYADIFTKTLAQTLAAPSNPPAQGTGRRITHIFWPEAAMPFLALRTPGLQERLREALSEGSTLIAGSLRLEGSLAVEHAASRKVYNSVLVFDDGGRLETSYDKFHLVPFGEYLPFQKTLESAGLLHLTRQRGGFTSAAGPRRLLAIPGLPPTSMLICYEVIFPKLATAAGARPGLLVNLTNDAWFGTTSGPYQHYHQSRVRAVEQGIPLLRVANNGISAIIGPRGRVQQSLPLNVAGVIDGPVPLPLSKAPIYARYGDTVFFGLFGLVCALLFVLWVRERSQIHTNSVIGLLRQKQ